MKKARSSLTLEEGILILQKRGENASISVGEILQTLSGKGQSFILLFLSLPFCLPLQIPGLSTPFGLLIAFIGLRRAFGKRIWLPRSFLEKEIKPSTMRKITGKALWLVQKMKRWVHPRLAGLCHYPASQIVNSLLIAVLGLFLALPLPIPFSNLMAAWSIFFVAFGLLEDDGIFILMGYVIALLTLGFFIATLKLIL